MKSNNNTIFKNMLIDIADKTGFTDKQISLKVGRNSGYIAQLRSRIKNNTEEVPQKFIDLLKLHFANYNMAAEEQDDYITAKNKDAGKLVGNIKEEIILIKASIKVFGMELSELKAKQNKSSFSAESLALEKTISLEVDRLFDAEKRKLKQP